MYLGGNDLAYLGEIEVYNRARDFITRVSEHARIVRVCNIEHSFYPEGSNRAHLNSEYKRKRNQWRHQDLISGGAQGGPWNLGLLYHIVS